MDTIGAERLEAEDEKRIEELLAGSFGSSFAAPGGPPPRLEAGDRVDAALRRELVADLVEGLDLDSVGRVLDSFIDVTGMALALISTSGKLLAATKWQPICSRFYRIHTETRMACEETDRAVNAAINAASAGGEEARPGPYRYRCANGLREIAQPLFIEGTHWATICLGQFLYEGEEVDEAALAARSRELGWDEAAFLAALRAVPRYTEAEVERALDFCVAFGNLVSRLNNSCFRERRLARYYLEIERALADALEQKNFLFAELQHRVKNSLSLIASLLSLEASSLEDGRARSAFDDARGRIRSVSLLYERLYKTGSAASIDLGPYVAETVRSSIGGAAVAEAAPALEIDCESAAIDTRRAVYVGLLVNELAVNAMKHAFAEGRPGRIRVSLRVQGGRAVLGVSDDGLGLPPGFSLEAQTSLGSLVVRTLAKQLDGEVETGPGLAREAAGGRPGSSFVVRFPLSAS